MMMIGRCSKGQHHIAVLVLAPDERTNEQNASFLRWEKNNVGVVGLINTRFGPHKREKGFCIFVEAKEKRFRIWKDISLGEKRGLQRDLSLSLSSTIIDDDGCAVASRHVTTRTTPRAAFFLLPLFSLSLSLSLFVFCFFHSPSFLYLVVRTSHQSRTSVSRDTLLCVT